MQETGILLYCSRIAGVLNIHLYFLYYVGKFLFVFFNSSNFLHILSMVYFWTYAHPSYCPSDLLARGFTAARWTSNRSARPPSLS